MVDSLGILVARYSVFFSGKMNQEQAFEVQVDPAVAALTQAIGLLLQNQNTVVMPEVTSQIKSFSGREESVLAEDWLNSIEYLAEINRWNGDIKVQVARNNMTHGAREWYLGRRDNIRGWDDFVFCFRKSFIFEGSAGDRYERMKRRIQLRSEPLSDYFHEKIRLCNACHLTEDEKKHFVLSGLLSQEVALAVANTQTGDDDELLVAIRKTQQLIDAKRGQQMEKRMSFSQTEHDINKTRCDVTTPKTVIGGDVPTQAKAADY